MDRTDIAINLFKSGHNCAQSVSGAFADILLNLRLKEQDKKNLSFDEIDKESKEFKDAQSELLQLSAGFGAGMGGLRETCGTVSGMIIIAGLLKGNYKVDAIAEKTEFYNIIKKLVSTFTEKHETTNCKQLLQKAACSALPDPSERTAEYYKKRPCIKYVVSAVEILEKIFFS